MKVRRRREVEWPGCQEEEMQCRRKARELDWREWKVQRQLAAPRREPLKGARGGSRRGFRACP